MRADTKKIMAETTTQEREEVEATDSPDHDEDADTGDFVAPERDPEWETAAKPALSDEERLQGLEPEKLKRMARDMFLARRFEEKAGEMYAVGKIGGFCHLYIGQEAVAVGAIHALEPEDYVMTAYREHAHALQAGIEPGPVMAELFGRADGCSGGMGGSMHMFSREHRYLGGHGIVGGQCPLALGVAWAIKYRDEERIIQAYMGEAAVNQGAFHESMNMAALWELPVVYIVENNRYGMGTAWERASSLYDIAPKAEAYSMPCAIADGMDVLDVYRVAKRACDRARSGGGPTLIEARTHRFMGHSMSDAPAGVYRTKEELEEVKGKDPITAFLDLLQRQEILSDEEREEMDAEAKRIAEQAVEFAEASPEPDPEALYAHVYQDEDAAGRLYLDGRR
jgi:pyruvate dehydrogenase E1 component alpha subunit